MEVSLYCTYIYNDPCYAVLERGCQRAVGVAGGGAAPTNGGRSRMHVKQIIWGKVDRKERNKRFQSGEEEWEHMILDLKAMNLNCEPM